LRQLAVGTTGNLYATLAWMTAGDPSTTFPGPLPPTPGVFFAALDSSGAILTGDEHNPSFPPAVGVHDTPLQAPMFHSDVSVVGASNYAFHAWFSQYGSNVSMSPLVPYNDAWVYTHTLTEHYGTPPGFFAYCDLAGFRDLAGDTFLYAVTTNMASCPFPFDTAPNGAALVKLDPTNAIVWQLPVPPLAAVSVAPDTGSTYIWSRLSGTVDLGCGAIAGSGTFAGEIDSAGTCVWSRAVGTSASIVNAGAHDYLVGTFDGSLDLGCGAMTSSASTSYVAMLDAATGRCLWSKPFPGVSLAFSLLPTGEPLLTGAIPGTADVGCGPLTGGSNVAYVAKLDTTGACVWSRTFAGGFDVVPFSSGDLGVAVSFTGSVDFGCGPLSAAGTQDLALGRLAGATGACVWSKRFGAAGAQVAFDQAGTSSALGYLVAFGSVNAGAVDFGAGPLSSTYFALELDGSGAFRFAKAVSPLSEGQPLFAVDPCGSPVTVTACATCGPNSALGESVTKLAP
jgi:hypothetical protein